MKWTQQIGTDVLEWKRTAQVECVCVSFQALFLLRITYQAVVSLLVSPLNTISQVLLRLSSFSHRSNVGNS